MVREGEQIYNNTCISCHGANLEGVKDRGPSLIGVGEAAVYFQTSTGRMPAVVQGAQAQKKPAVLTPEEIDAVSAYIQANGGGVEMPEERGEALRGDGPGARRRAVPAQLRVVPQLHRPGRRAVVRQGGAGAGRRRRGGRCTRPCCPARRTCRGSPTRQLTPEEKKDIIAYVKSVTDGNNNPGGSPIGGLGPQSEGFIAFVVGIVALLGITLWIGAKA